MLLKKSKMEPAPFYSLASQRIMNTIGEVFIPVSYTHLDVYKRQVYDRADAMTVKVGNLQFFHKLGISKGNWNTVNLGGDSASPDFADVGNA